MTNGQRKANAEKRWLLFFAVLVLFFGWLLDDVEQSVMLAWPLVIAACVIKAMIHLHEEPRP